MIVTFFFKILTKKSFICYYISAVPLINSRVKFYTGILRVNERQQLANCYQVLGEVWPLYLDHWCSRKFCWLMVTELTYCPPVKLSTGSPNYKAASIMHAWTVKIQPIPILEQLAYIKMHGRPNEKLLELYVTVRGSKPVLGFWKWGESSDQSRARDSLGSTPSKV